MRVAIVIDLVTSGSSILEAIRAVREAGRVVVLEIAMVDRNAGGRAAVEALGVRYQPLLMLEDLGLT